MLLPSQPGKFWSGSLVYRNEPKFSDSLVWANYEDSDQIAAEGAAWSGSTVFAILSASFGHIMVKPEFSFFMIFTGFFFYFCRIRISSFTIQSLASLILALYKTIFCLWRLSFFFKNIFPTQLAQLKMN